MCLLFETIACNNSLLQNLEWHEKRMNNSRKKLWDCANVLNLDFIKIPEFAKSGVWKCKVLYKQTIVDVEFESYQPKEVKSFKLVESDIDYSHKYLDRTGIDQLMHQREGADEIIIIKNGLVTDTSIGNILLFDGDVWITPDQPLLPGTMRASLLASKQIQTKRITGEELRGYQKIMVVNALNPFDVSRVLDISPLIY
ncbi:MAG: aminotransferase class IV family protein [Bacteroidota bacterium]